VVIGKFLKKRQTVYLQRHTVVRVVFIPFLAVLPAGCHCTQRERIYGDLMSPETKRT